MYQCSPRHPPRGVPVLATSSATWCTGVRHVIRHVVYRYSPRHPPRGVPVLAMSSATWCTGARHVIRHVVNRCSPRHPPRGVPVLATSSATWCTGACLVNRSIINHRDSRVVPSVGRRLRGPTTAPRDFAAARPTFTWNFSYVCDKKVSAGLRSRSPLFRISTKKVYERKYDSRFLS